MFKTIKEAFKIKEVRIKIWITLALLLVYRIGCWIPVPGIDVSVFRSAVTSDNGGFFSLLSSISGGALSNGAILALGVAPYINASIIIQLLSYVIPSLERLSKEGDAGRQKINFYTRVAALIMSIAQAVGIVLAFSNSGLLTGIIEGTPAWVTGIAVVLVLVAGGMFTLWLGEKISDLGIANGLSLIIFVGILSTAGTSILNYIKNIIAGDISGIWSLVIFLVAVILVFGLIVFVDLAERRIPVQYANQIRGRKMYGGQSTNIPLKINGGGVMPIIFASAILTFPQLIMSIFWPTSSAYKWYATYLGGTSWVYIVVSSALIFAFAFFYAQLTFNPDEVSKNIQQNGGFIPGYRPGRPTADYLRKISKRITLFCAIFLAFVNLIPSLVFKSIEGYILFNAFSATGMLIVVSVAIELNQSLENQLLTRTYKGFLK